jgi:two-component system OmpR family sensor kinase
MKNISVTSFIHTIFLIALIVISLTFYILLNATQDQRHLQQIFKYKFIANTFILSEHVDKDGKEVKDLFKKYSLKKVDEKKARELIQKKGETIFTGSSIYGEVKVVKVDDRYFIYVNRYDYDMMLEDMHPIDYTTQLIFTIALLLVVILLILYIMVLKKLSPLKRLHKEIEQFANGDLDVKITYEGDDEIAKIAKSFDKAIKHIKQLISSKNLFMRNIMHELKTPITTSRIAAETIEDDLTKKVLIRSFDRMNELIEDLAQVERVTMYTFVPVKEDTTFKEVFDETEKILLKDKSLYEFKYKNCPLYTDKSLLALVLKNLIDNAIKYSTDKKANILVVGNKIMVKSKGEKLKEDLEYYIEPFSQAEKRSAGFGLGLYIVATVLEKLNYKLRYRYDKKQQENIFEIVID